MKNILLAEDDDDDPVFFQKGLSEIPVLTKLIRVKDGMQLMELLLQFTSTPGIIFPDVNMPRKNGQQCLSEIRAHQKLKHLPVIIFSTSSAEDIVTWMFNPGANTCIIKPGDFQKWKRVIEKAINTDWTLRPPVVSIEKFVLT